MTVESDSKRVSPALAISCAVGATLATAYSGLYIFYRLPVAEDLFKSVKVKIPGYAIFMMDYGMIVWFAILAAVVLSFLLAFRRPQGRGTAEVAATTFLASIVFAIMTHQAVWGPTMNLLQGIGTQP